LLFIDSCEEKGKEVRSIIYTKWPIKKLYYSQYSLRKKEKNRSEYSYHFNYQSSMKKGEEKGKKNNPKKKENSK